MKFYFLTDKAVFFSPISMQTLFVKKIPRKKKGDFISFFYL